MGEYVLFSVSEGVPDVPGGTGLGSRREVGGGDGEGWSEGTTSVYPETRRGVGGTLGRTESRKRERPGRRFRREGVYRRTE